jgi:hypothetical protein
MDDNQAINELKKRLVPIVPDGKAALVSVQGLLDGTEKISLFDSSNEIDSNIGKYPRNVPYVAVDKTENKSILYYSGKEYNLTEDLKTESITYFDVKDSRPVDIEQLRLEMKELMKLLAGEKKAG